jgi:hypothetical protein
MRILFYLPVVTPWWFDEIVGPLIRAASRGAEVHVLVPPLWRNTGIEGAQLMACADLDVTWHILDGDDHPQLRHSARDQEDLLELVRAIAPDLSLCRSADIETPAHFPGVVRYIMEGGAPPFRTDPHAVYLSHTLFDHGILPELRAAERTWLKQSLAPAWQRIRHASSGVSRDEFLRRAGIPAGRRLIGLPLEYEHEEIFFEQHNPYGNNVGLIETLAPGLDDDTILAVTNHPLNELHSDNGPLREAIARHAGKVRLLGQIGGPGEATMLLARHCDGMVVGNSKSFGNCAFFGTPMLRLSRFATGAWMHAYDTWEPFLAAVRKGRARGADEAPARRWFAFHLANNVFDPTDPELDAAALADRAINPVNTSRWEAALAGQVDLDPSELPPPLTQKNGSLCHV